jgi:hypothetical protein
LIDNTGTLGFGVNMLSSPPGGNVCDVYLLDYQNRGLFEQKLAYNYITIGSRENVRAGIIQVNGLTDQTYFVGIKNPDGFYGINFAIEVVAVVLQEEYATRIVKVPNTTTYQIPYLKN